MMAANVDGCARQFSSTPPVLLTVPYCDGVTVDVGVGVSGDGVGVVGTGVGVFAGGGGGNGGTVR